MPRHCSILLASPAEWHSAFSLLFHHRAAFHLGNWHLWQQCCFRGTWTYDLFLVPQILCFSFGSRPFWLIWPDGAIRDARIPNLNLLMRVSRAEAAPPGSCWSLLSPPTRVPAGLGLPETPWPHTRPRALEGYQVLLSSHSADNKLQSGILQIPLAIFKETSGESFIPGGRNWTTHIWIALSVWKRELLNANCVMLSEASLSPGSHVCPNPPTLKCLLSPFSLFHLREERCLSRFWNQPTGTRGTSQVFPGSSNISL